MAFAPFQIEIFRYIHSKGMLFHDVKPANMAIGDGPEHHHKIFFYDFAFGQLYANEMGEPVRREQLDELNGTPDYFAIEALRGHSHTRRDELFSFGVCLLHLNNADLPWVEKTKGIQDIFKAMSIVLSEWEHHGLEVSFNVKLHHHNQSNFYCFFFCSTGDLQHIGSSETISHIFQLSRWYGCRRSARL